MKPLLCVFLIGMLSGHLAAEIPRVEPSTAKSAADNAEARTNQTPRIGARERSLGIEEINQMVAAGVSTEVIQTLIENATVTRTLTAAEIISLKQHGVPDAITTALLKRAAVTKARSAEAATRPPPLDIGSLDPEGYDFWWHHYGYPRILSSGYRSTRMFPVQYHDFLAPRAHFSFAYRDRPFGWRQSFSHGRIHFYGHRPGFGGRPR